MVNELRSYPVTTVLLITCPLDPQHCMIHKWTSQCDKYIIAQDRANMKIWTMRKGERMGVEKEIQLVIWTPDLMCANAISYIIHILRGSLSINKGPWNKSSHHLTLPIYFTNAIFILTWMNQVKETNYFCNYGGYCNDWTEGRSQNSSILQSFPSHIAPET